VKKRRRRSPPPAGGIKPEETDAQLALRLQLEADRESFRDRWSQPKRRAFAAAAARTFNETTLAASALQAAKGQQERSDVQCWGTKQQGALKLAKKGEERTAGTLSTVDAQPLAAVGGTCMQVPLSNSLVIPGAKLQAAKAPTSEFRGVSHNAKMGNTLSKWKLCKWMASIVDRDSGKTRYLGYFIDEQIAAHAYDTALREQPERKRHPKHFNFPLPGERHVNDRRHGAMSPDARAAAEAVVKERAAMQASSSTFRGVYWARHTGMWRAELHVTRKSRCLGDFLSEVDAARAYDKALREAPPGRFAKTFNFPETGEAGQDAASKAVAKAERIAPHPSSFRGVSWNKIGGKWNASIQWNGKKRSLGYFIDELTAARAYDTALRAQPAWKDQPKAYNFPRKGELQGKGIVATVMNPKTLKARAVSKAVVKARVAAQAETSAFRGVCWNRSKWRAEIARDGKCRVLGAFTNEEAAARAYDTALREAPAGRVKAFNFPLEGEAGQDAAARAKAKKDRAAVKRYSAFCGVSWYKTKGLWIAQVWSGGAQKSLGYFANEIEAARAYDTALHAACDRRFPKKFNFPQRYVRRQSLSVNTKRNNLGFPSTHF
jgi:hypothetical protein